MSDDKIQAEVLKSVENESSYRQFVPGILTEINAGKKPYITNVLKAAQNVISGSKYDASLKCLTLLLIKDIMQLNQTAFIQSLADSKVMSNLESLALKNPKTDKEFEKVFGEKPEAKHTKRFYILMMECIKVWGTKFKDQKGFSQKYTTILNNLIKKKIPIPEKYYYFPDKDASKMSNSSNVSQGATQSVTQSAVQGAGQGAAQTGKTNAQAPVRTEQQLIQLIQKLSQQYEPVIEQAFCYYSQELEVDEEASSSVVEPLEKSQGMKSPTNQIPAPVQNQNEVLKQTNGPAVVGQGQQQGQAPEEDEEVFPLMYNAQELEADGADEYLPGYGETAKINKPVENKEDKEKQQKAAALALATGVIGDKEKQLKLQEQQRTAAIAEQQRLAEQEKQQKLAAEQEKQQKLAAEQKLAEQEKQQKAAAFALATGVLADKEKQQKLAEQQRTAAIAEQQRLAEQEKQQKLAAEQEKQQRLAEQERQKKLAEEKRLAAEQEKARLAEQEIQQRLAEKEKQQRLASEQEKKQEKQSEQERQQKLEKEKLRKAAEQERIYRESELRQQNQPKIDINIVMDPVSIQESLNERKKPLFTKLDAENRLVDPENSIRPSPRGSRGYLYSPNDSGIRDAVPLPISQELSSMKKRPKEIEVIEYEPPAQYQKGNDKNGDNRSGQKGQERKSSVREEAQRISPAAGKKVSFDERHERDMGRLQSPKETAIKIRNEPKVPSRTNLDFEPQRMESAKAQQQKGSEFVPPMKYSSPKAEANIGFLAGMARSNIPEPAANKYKDLAVKAQKSPKQEYVDTPVFPESTSSNSNPLVQTKEMEQLKQKNDRLQAENERIKNELLRMEKKIKSEKEQVERRPREYEPVRVQHDHRSNSSTGKTSRKTEMAGAATYSRNKFLASDMNAYHAGRSLSNTGHQQQKVRGRSPKVEPFSTVNMAATASTFGSFGAELRRVNQMYSTGNDYFAQSISAGDQGMKFASTTTAGFYPSPDKRRRELSPGAINTMNKTELLQQRTWNEPFGKKYTGSHQKIFSKHEDLPFSTNLYRFKLACLRDNEVLYEDDNFKIESKTYYIPEREGILIVELIYTNKGESVITEFAVTYKSISGFDIRPEETALSSVLAPGENQHHQLNTEVNGYPRDVGLMVVEFRLENEPRQLKLNFPLIMTKFLVFNQSNSTEFTKKRKTMLANHPTNIEESIKLRINKDHLEVLEETLFSKMMSIPVEGAAENRFNIYGGIVTLGTSQLEYIVRIIVEIETSLMLIQVVYPIGGDQDAKLILEKLIFLCNETSLL